MNQTASSVPRTLVDAVGVGVRLDGNNDWDELATICEEAFRTVAAKKLIAELDRRG